MKTFFNKFGEAMVTVFIVVLLVIASPVIFIWLVIKTIRDYFKYKDTQYYRDTCEKYSWLCADSYHVAFYNAIKDANLPVNYYRDNAIKITGYGYFIYNDILILCDYDSDTFYFDKDKDDWLVYDEHDYLLLETEIDEEIKKVNEFLGGNICKKAFLFIESELLEEAPEKNYERIEFLPVTDGDKILALRNKVVKFQ